MQKFPLKRMLITGGGSGLGQALALEFASRGWKIGIAEIKPERAQQSANLINAAGGQGLVIACDVTSMDDVKTAAGQMQDAWGGVDVVVNNADVFSNQLLIHLSDRDLLQRSIIGFILFLKTFSSK